MFYFLSCWIFHNAARSFFQPNTIKLLMCCIQYLKRLQLIYMWCNTRCCINLTQLHITLIRLLKPLKPFQHRIGLNILYRFLRKQQPLLSIAFSFPVLFYFYRMSKKLFCSMHTHWYFVHTMHSSAIEGNQQRQEHQCTIRFHQYHSRTDQQPEADPYGCLLWYPCSPQKGIQILPTIKQTARKHRKTFLLPCPISKRIIEGLNVPVIGIDGYEADDVIWRPGQAGRKSRVWSLHGYAW